MALSWSTRRQLLYYVVAGVVGFILVLAMWKAFFTNTPTCSDGIQNGMERGVDCGGSCSLVCKSDAHSPRVRWARSFETSPSTYTAAAYIENGNVGAGARSVRYSFQLLDSNNILVVERGGVLDLPPMATIPIVETNISVGNRAVARTLFSFADEPVWNKVSKSLPALRLSEQALTEDASRLGATLVNDSTEDISRVVVTAVLFDNGGVARAASKTTLVNVLRKSTQPVVFTWPQGVPDIVRAEMTVIPSF